MTPNVLAKKIEVLGMIHCAGSLAQSLAEIDIYAQEGLDGAIVENYHGDILTVIEVMRQAKISIPLGVNILPNNYVIALEIARQRQIECGASFIQLDHASGQYVNKESFAQTLDPSVNVYGGVWPKYYTPVAGSRFDDDLRAAIPKTHAIVITGAGIGKETPLDKIAYARKIIGNHKLIVGAGVTSHNCLEQLAVADGCIVGSAFKARTDKPVDVYRVRDFMAAVRQSQK